MINKKHTLYTHVFSVVLWCVFTFWVPCNDVHYDFSIKNDVQFVFTSSCLC